MPGSEFKFEVNIVVYKRADMANKLIEQIRDEYPDAFIRIWDNSPTRVKIKNADEHRWNRFNPSLSRVWNWAIAQSESEWVMVTNDDITLRPGWRKALEDEVSFHPRSLWFGPSRCFLFNKKLLETVGWFDERLTGITYEDLDYIRRMNHAGIVHNYGMLSFFEHFAVSRKDETLSDRFNPPAQNVEYFKLKYEDQSTESFVGAPKFGTPDFYPNRSIHES